MLIRDGFVSNSSSTAFILDLREDAVKELVKRSTVKEPCSLGRQTALAIGKRAVYYAQDWIEATEEWHKDGYDDERDLGPWILKWAERLGEDNVVFARESDEGMGGYLDFRPDALAVDEMEYH